MAYETGHAYGIKTKQGGEILIHIGIDTVGLEGLRKRILDSTTMIVVTNTPAYKEIQLTKAEAVEANELLLELKV